MTEAPMKKPIGGDDIEYADPSVDAYEAQHRTRALRNLRTRAQQLGLGVIDLETGELMEPGVS